MDLLATEPYMFL